MKEGSESVAKKSQSYMAQKSENIRAIIADIKIRRHLTDAGVAKLINMPLGTFRARKADPGLFRLCEIWMLYQAAEVPEERRSEVV